MIRAIRIAPMARADASLITGWNIAPNVAYLIVLSPSASACGVAVFSEDGATLIASGAAATGADKPVMLYPYAGQSVEMVDADIGWHLLITSVGNEGRQEMVVGPAVDLPDEIHPVYGDDDLALARATAAIDAAAHYIDDVTVTCPLGLSAGLGDVVSVPVDGAAVVGQVESITWTATPVGTSEQAVIRRYVAIAPEAFVEQTPPTVADDAGAATHLVGTSGDVLANDTGTLTVVAVNGLSSNVGASVDGDNGGAFVINSDGSWTFCPDGDFALLEGSETADTSVTYHASDGTAEAMATLTVTVSRQNAAPVAVDDTGETDAATTTSGNVLTNDTDADGDTLDVSRVAGSTANVGVAVAGSNGGLFTIGSDGAWSFDPNSEFSSLTGDNTSTTSVSYHVSDGTDEDEGLLTVTVSATSSPLDWTFAEVSPVLWLQDPGSTSGADWDSTSPATIGASQSDTSKQPTMSSLDDMTALVFDGVNDNMQLDSMPLSGTTPRTLFIVAQPDTLAQGKAVFSLTDYNASAGGQLWDICLESGQIAVRVWGNAVYAAAVSTTDPNIIAISWASGNVFTTSVRLNGVQLSRTGGSDTAINTMSGVSRLGYALRQSPGGYFAGKIAAVVLCASALSQADQQRGEGKLAHDLGRTDLLPSDHPYKSAAPTI